MAFRYVGNSGWLIREALPFSPVQILVRVRLCAACFLSNKPSPSQLVMVTETQPQSDGNTAFLRAARAGHLDKVLEQLKNNVDINTSNANGLNALHLASKDGHMSVVSELLKRGANVDSATKKGNTALHIASLAGQEEVVKHLVEHGACVNVQSQNGFTPLYMAAQENHDSVVKFLLANGANQSLATEDGFTPLAVAMQQGHDKVVAVLLENDTRGKVRLPALHIAAKKDDCKAAALLLQNEHNPDVTSKSGFTPLHIASHYGNEGIANLLLSKGADVNFAAKHNITPLHVAAKWGKANMVSTLLSRGANIEAKTRDGLTPLHCAARSGHEQVVDMLLERGAPISAKTKNGLAALHMSSQGDHVDAARILLYHRAPVDDVTVDYLTALHVAAHCGHVGVARLLLDRKADPNARALNGFTPLHIACKKNRIKVVELLLKHGASIEATTESGLTPLHVASFMGCMNIVIYLVQNEAGPDVTTVRGETPLHLAARANQTDIIRILLRNDAQVDARAREQQTPLHIASRLGNVDIVMLLLQHGASVDSTTKDLYTALHIAAKEGQDEVASVLLENGASLEATTKKGFTPLHLAAKYGHMNVAKLLLRRDAPVDAQGKNGVTPLHVASHYDHQNVALLLLEKGASPHATAKNGHTPLHIAARKNQMDIATTLLEYGAKANAESKAGFTPLHLSAQEGHADMSNLLIEHQADINHKAKNGLTPLHLCAQEDCVEVGTILLKNNAQVNCTTKAGYTPLHVASHFGQMGMVRLLLSHGANVTPTTAVNYTPLHQAAQQGHSGIVNALLEAGANPNATTNQGQTALSIAQKLGYISVVESLKGVTDTPISPTSADEKYKVVAPETMQETFMSDSEDEGGDVLGLEYGFTPAHPHVYLPYFQGDSIFTREETMLSEQPYHYLTVDEMKGLGDDSLPIDVTRDERDNRDMGPPTAIDDTISPQHIKESYSQFTTADNVDITKHPLHVGKLQWRNFLVSFLVDARGGAMRGCRHSGVRVIVPPRRASMPLRVTCRYLKRDKLPHPPPLMEGEALASRILELGPVGAKFLGPVMIEVPHFGSLRGKEREIVILRSDNGETWREHTFEATEEAIHDVLSHSFEKDEINQVDDSGRTTRILTTEFPHYIAVVSRVRQEVHAIGPEGGMVSSTVVPQVQAVFPHGALTKKIKVGLQAQPIPTELTAKLLGNRVAVSPIVTVEPRRRKFHKPISLTIPVPQAANKGMINQYSGDAPTLRLLCSITGGTTRAQWEDVTGSTPLTFVNDCVSFTTTVSARFWLMDCRNISEATKMATELYREAIHVPFMAKFVVFAKRVDTTEARLRVFCMTDDKEDKTLEHQEHFTEVAKSRDVEVLEGKMQYLEFAGNLVPVTKSGEQLQLGFRAFKENRLPFTGRVKDPHADALGRIIFMREPKVAKGDAPQQPICILNIVLPEEIIPDSDLHDQETPKHSYITHTSGLQRLSDISNLLGEDWVKLANELDISTSEINSIKTELCDLSEAQQGFALLRLWLQSAGNKATASALEKGLRNIGRDDIIQQTVFSMDQTDPYVLSEDLSPSYTTCHNVFRKTITVQKEIITDKRKEGKQIPVKDAIDKHDHDEKKYSAEEKEVEEELHKSVSERKKEIEKRLSQDFDDKKKEKFTTKETKTIEESMKTSIKTAEKDKKLLDELGEKEIAEEKAVSPEPAHLSFDEKRKSFEMGITPKEKIKQLENLQKFIKEEQSMAQETVTVVQREKSVEKGVVEEESLSFQEKRLSFEQGLAMKKPGDKLPSSETQKDVSETKVTTEFTKVDEKHTADYRRDSELFEEVSQGLGKLKTGVIKAQPQDLLSPMVVKTPPPSPAEFSKEPPDNKKWSSDIQTSLLSGEGERHTTETTKEAIDPKKILNMARNPDEIISCPKASCQSSYDNLNGILYTELQEESVYPPQLGYSEIENELIFQNEGSAESTISLAFDTGTESFSELLFSLSDSETESPDDSVSTIKGTETCGILYKMSEQIDKVPLMLHKQKSNDSADSIDSDFCLKLSSIDSLQNYLTANDPSTDQVKSDTSPTYSFENLELKKLEETIDHMLNDIKVEEELFYTNFPHLRNPEVQSMEIEGIKEVNDSEDAVDSLNAIENQISKLLNDVNSDRQNHQLVNDSQQETDLENKCWNMITARIGNESPVTGLHTVQFRESSCTPSPVESYSTSEDEYEVEKPKVQLEVGHKSGGAISILVKSNPLVVKKKSNMSSQKFNRSLPSLHPSILSLPLREHKSVDSVFSCDSTPLDYKTTSIEYIVPYPGMELESSGYCYWSMPNEPEVSVYGEGIEEKTISKEIKQEILTKDAEDKKETKQDSATDVSKHLTEKLLASERPKDETVKEEVEEKFKKDANFTDMSDQDLLIDEGVSEDVEISFSVEEDGTSEKYEYSDDDTSPTKPYITTPTQTRRNTGIGGSQRLSQGERPTVRVVTDFLVDAYESDEEENYMVTEPYERPQEAKRNIKIRFSPDLYDDDEKKPSIEEVKEADKCEASRNVEKVEKCFERMASKTKEADPKESVHTEGEFEKMVSQLSLEEVDQALHQWEAGGLTPSDIDSKEITVSSEEISPSQQESSHTPEREESGEIPPIPSPRVPVKPQDFSTTPKSPSIELSENETYTTKKMFWEQISSGSTETMPEKETPPVPKPRKSLTSSTVSSDVMKSVQSSYSDASGKLEASDIDEDSLNVQSTTTTEKVVAGFTKEPSLSLEGDNSEIEYIKAHELEELSYDNDAFNLCETDEVQALPKHRKPIYERSVSLPCDSSIENSNVRAKKRVFEAQIKKEMVVEQLMAQLEEESSPEHKSIEQKTKPPTPNAQAMVSRQIHSDIFSNELEEQIEFHIPENKEIVEKVVSSSIQKVDEMHDSKTEISAIVKEHKESYDSTLSTNVQEALQYKADAISKPSDSLEVHVDKSELEDSEKEKEIDEEIKTMKGLKEAGVPMPSVSDKEKFGSLTSSQGESEDTFSESDVTPEDARFKENQEITDWALSEKNGKLNLDAEDTIKQRIVYTPEEHIPDTVWEVPVQEEVEAMEEETVQFPTSESKSVTISSIKEVVMSESEARKIAENVVDEIESKLLHCEGVTKTINVEDDFEMVEKHSEIRSSIDLSEPLSRKSDQIMKLMRTDTTTSSMEITDEDLRSSGVETDNSPLESQAGRLEPLDEGNDSSDDVDNQELDQEPFGKEVVEKTLAEVKQSLEAVKEELIEEKKKKKDSITKESPSEFEFKSVSLENTFNETIQECHHEEMSSVQTYKQSFETQIINESLIKDLESRTEKESESTKDLVKDKEQEFLSKSEEVAVEKTTQKTLQEVQSNVEMKVEESVVTETTEKLLRDNTKIKFTADTLDSSDSPVSETKPEDRRSPVQDEGGSTSSSSEQKFGSDGAEIGSSFVTRKHKKTHVTVKQDQKSDCELYSSSGESHYQSFEQTSDSIKTPGSRPLSSDIEGLVANMSGATGSSEYESAISHEISGHSTTITSKEYHTAVSSLSSRDSMKSLDSESSGNLASVEVSSEASETLVPSAMELEKDTDGESVMAKSGKQSHKVEEQIKMQSFSESIEQSVSFDISTEDLSEEEVPVLDQESSARMKRSHEMTFQPEPRPIIAETDINKSLEDKFMASIEDVSSLVSSLDTTALNTVVELSKTESARMDGSGTSEQLSLTVSATSEAFSISDSKEQEEVDTVVSKVESVSTQSPSLRSSDLLESVTITTSSVVEQGVQSVCTQVTSKTTSHSNGPTQVDYVPEYDEGEPEVKKRGHRRNGSTSFRPSMIPVFHTRQVEKKKSEDIAEDTAESDKYSESLTLKEGAQEEKKDIDEAERLEEEFYQTEADQGLHRDIREGRVVLEDTYVHDDIKSYDYDISASVSKSRLPSAAFSDDHADSELAELLKQCSTDIITEDPIERPKTPEPIEECEIKDDTPEFSSEAQASVTELEMEYSGAFSRTSEYEAHISPIREKGMMPYESLEQVEHEQELTEAEAAFHSGLPDTSLPKTIFEKSIVEKHELETQELSLKEEPTDTKLRSSPVPGITITQHVSQTLKDSFDNLEGPVTPLPSSAIPDKEKQEVSSEKCFTFTEDKYQELLADEPFPSEDTSADLRQESKDESMTDSPTSDSFEILEKPDIADEFVIIEEVAKEAEEQDTEGKGILISQARPISRPYKQPEEDEILVSPPTTTTKLTKLKYYSGGNEEDILFDFDSGSPSKKEVSEEKVEASSTESSPPVAGEQDFKPEVEAGKKWMEMQFQGEPVAPIYGYDIEFERGPLEDIKEEDINDLESSSKIGSMGSQVSHSIGSFGSVKASLSSTPDYDVLAGRKFFTRSGEHDDVSMSSLQEFERLENLIALESTKHRSLGSQDSLTSSSNSRKHGRSAGDDISLASLKEFEGLESACIAAEHIEKKAKAEEESLLSEIEEGHESQTSESESCTTVSAGGINRAESDEDDYERRMFEIDEIIRQAQTNVEQFMGQQKDFTESGIKCETLGRADSIEEISKVPELDLDQPVSYSSGKSYIQHWEDLGEDLLTSTDSLEVKTQISKTSIADPFTTSTDSLELKISHDVMSISTDSIEASQKDKKKDIMTDSIEMGDKRANVTSTDSLEGKVTQASSIDEDEQQGAGADQSSSSGKEGDLSSGKEDSVEGAVGMTTNRMPPPRAEFLLGSTDSLEPTSSTATHATYHYETDSVMSSSFTSGDSTTMVDDNEEDAARASYWFDEGKPYVTEVIEPIIGDDEFPQMIHRTVEMPPEICKITFKGEDAEKGLREYIEKFDPGEDVTETREVDKDGNVHIKRIIQKRVVIRPEELGGDTTNLTGSDLQKYLQSLTDAQIGSTSPLLETFQISSPIESQTSITTIQRTTTSSQVKGETVKCDQQPKETEIPHRGSRPPLKYDISVDEDPEYDPREHDWRFNLHTHLEGEEETQGFASGSSVGATRAGKQGDKAEKK
ncbi:ankyrin-2-like isoform X5 [Cimex lectularius]|uniref:Ankyrin-3 n=1 Tax=Cimex lectularius TaxID=79782 RepID=A0A8I6SJV2_CIMLE|nr:ankyrin-2-like isoform X5 [Cimex lectularius]